MLPFTVHSNSNILTFRRKHLTEIKSKHLICTQQKFSTYIPALLLSWTYHFASKSQHLIYERRKVRLELKYTLQFKFCVFMKILQQR